MKIFCKLEYLQRTGSFKERGARNALLLLPPEQRRRGVIAASAGNHALGLAYHAQLLGWYDMHPEPYAFSYKGAWGVYPFLPSGRILISEMQHGLFVLDISQALSMKPDADHDSALRPWPNPATDGATLALPPDVGGDPHVNITDATGRTVPVRITRRTPVEYSLDTRNFASGTYAITATTKDRRWFATLTIVTE